MTAISVSNPGHPLTRRRFLTLAGAAAFAANVGGCGGSRRGAPATLRVFLPLNAYETAFLRREILPLFEERHGARVTLAGVSAVEVFEQVATRGESFDLVAPDVDRLGGLSAGGLVREVGAARADLPPEAFLNSVPGLAGDGAVFALPFRPATWLAFYNHDLLAAAGQAPPATLDEQLAAARALREAGGPAGLALQGAPGRPAAQSLGELILAFGGDPLRPDTPEALAAGEYLQRLGPWLDPFSRDATFDSTTTALGGDRIAGGPNWPVIAADLLQRGGKREIRTTAGPRGPAGYGRIVGGQVLTVPTTAANPELALALARHLWSKPVQEQLAARLAWLPMRADAFGAAPDWQRPVAAAALDALRGAQALPALRDRQEFDRLLGDAFRRIAFEGADARQTLAAIAPGVRALR